MRSAYRLRCTYCGIWHPLTVEADGKLVAADDIIILEEGEELRDEERGNPSEVAEGRGRCIEDDSQDPPSSERTE